MSRLRRNHVVVAVRVAEAASLVERAGRGVARLDLEQDPARPLAGRRGGQGRGDGRAQALTPAGGVDLDRGQRAPRCPSFAEPPRPGRRPPRGRPGKWSRTPATGPTSSASARSAAGPGRGSGTGRGRPRRVRRTVRTSPGLAGISAISAVMTKAGPGRGTQDRSAKRSSRGSGPSPSAPWGRTIIGRRSRRRYQSSTAVTASGSGRPGSPTGRAELARPVKPAAARSRHSPSGSVSGACQCSAAARSRSSTRGSWAQAFAGSVVPGPRRRTRTRSRRCSGRVRSAAPSTVKPASAIISRSRAPAWPSLVR